jgi:hypothetical protein
VVALTEALVRECDSARRAVVRLESELATEREAERATEARAEASRRKAAEAEEAHLTAEDVVVDIY